LGIAGALALGLLPPALPVRARLLAPLLQALLRRHGAALLLLLGLLLLLLLLLLLALRLLHQFFQILDDVAFDLLGGLAGVFLTRTIIALALVIAYARHQILDLFF